MKNRNDGGYSLAMVLVIISVLAMIATALMTATINNMASQQNEAEKMQKQYEAQGKLEMVLSELSENQIVELTVNSTQQNALQKVIENACGDKANITETSPNTLKLWIIDANETIRPYTYNVQRPYETLFTYDFEISARSGGEVAANDDVVVTYSLKLAGRIAYDDQSDDDQNAANNPRLYIITSPEIVTKSVDIGGVA